MSYSSSLTIEELGVGGGRQARVVVLAGGGLPLMGAAWKSSNKVTTTWYPGNTSGSQQVIGPREMPSSWDGVWKRTILPKSGCTTTDEDGGESPIIAPSQIIEALEDIFRGGYRLRVTWAVATDESDSTQDQTANGSVVREGRAVDWEFKFDRWQDVNWSITFDWASRGTAPLATVAVRAKSIADSANALQASSDALATMLTSLIQASNPNVTRSASSFSLGQLESLADLPQAYMTQIQTAVNRQTGQIQQLAAIVAKVGAEPDQLKSSAMGIARDIIASANGTLDILGQQGAEQQSKKSTVSSVVRAGVYFSNVAQAYADLVAEAYAVLVALGRISPSATSLAGELPRTQATASPSDIIALYVTRQGDTPSSISKAYYQTTDHGVDILKANRLPWYQATFTPGRPLIIPRLSSTSGVTRS